ncbi:uncharacterized RING finger protein P32A8.03c-like [Zingiber officinale]|uniref:RING-type domain-containing protein n=1 Tax=Zingiber officinale TaxID=94328 RepID=A0A8J5LZM7_ZINOF|nr:uncharacterized RING finger protein P32A8.03c-like [Zingiber officinale]KAG6538126.1 hypothetical protein ZIOFF_003237 [Zingiber officinale]
MDTYVAFTEIPGWTADTSGVTLRIKARVVMRIWQPDQDIEPQLISHFCRQTISSSDHVTTEHAHFTIPQPYCHISHHPTWEEQTQRMLSYVAANHVRPTDLDLLSLAFRRYTYAVLGQFPITTLVAVMEFFSVVEIPFTPSASASQLHYSLPRETYEYFFGVEITQYNRGPRPASPATVEGLQMVTKMGEDSSCSICLDDFEVMTQALAMPCGHSFHEGCLKEWLRRKNSCPLCRFSMLPTTE